MYEDYVVALNVLVNVDIGTIVILYKLRRKKIILFARQLLFLLVLFPSFPTHSSHSDAPLPSFQKYFTFFNHQIPYTFPKPAKNTQ